MHTPGHAVLNAALISGAVGVVDPALTAAVVAGAIAPDLPILWLYARERWLRRTPEAAIWSGHYQRRVWQNLIHGAHSIPLALAGAAAGWAFGSVAVVAFFASMVAHSFADLPVHAIDAHRHFLPLSQWRFVSPISYWDPRYHGRTVAAVEIALVAGAGVMLWAWPAVPVLAWYLWSYHHQFLRRSAAVVV